MVKSTLITNARIVNEGKILERDILIKNGKIDKIDSGLNSESVDKIIDAEGKYLLPGVIDDQVHFREPGLTNKATIYTESKAAVAGGVTTFMEMPNTIPNALSQTLLEEKYNIASHTSLANYSFFMGASNNNIEEVLKTNKRDVCGIKIFMGSSTGNMLVDSIVALEKLFAKVDMLIATHCEDEATVRKNLEEYKLLYGDSATAELHPEIRNVEACYRSSSFAVNLAKKYNTRLHILHISTEEEIALFDNSIPLQEKRITSEVCVHHLWFDKEDYAVHGNKIKCNPSIKEKRHKKALLQALIEDKLDIIATDHAPHLLEEKSTTYWNAHSGLPLVSHPLQMMLQFYKEGKISLENIVEKMSHSPAVCFQIEDRGYIREGYWADLVLVDLDSPTIVEKENIYYKCGWSPLEGHTFPTKVLKTWVNGNLVYNQGEFNEINKGKRLFFKR